MKNLLSVEHITRYQYDEQVEMANHLAFMSPRTQDGQCVESLEWQISPQPDYLSHSTDTFGNIRSNFALSKTHNELTICVKSQVRVEPMPWDTNTIAARSWESVRDQLRQQGEHDFLDAREFVYDSPLACKLEPFYQYALTSFTPDRNIQTAAMDLMQRIFQDFSFSASATEVDTPALQSFERRAGVCQDFSHIMISCFRSLGLAAKYMSGYLLTNPAPGMTRLRGADVSHAWLSVWTGERWLDLDPTNNQIPDQNYVRVACGRDYGDIAPLKGVIRGGENHRLTVSVTVEPI